MYSNDDDEHRLIGINPLVKINSYTTFTSTLSDKKQQHYLML